MQLKSSLDLECDTKRTHEAGLGRDDYRAADQGGHRNRHRTVVTDTSLHEALLADGPAALDPFVVIHAYRVHEPGDHVFTIYALVEGTLDIAADKGRTLV